MPIYTKKGDRGKTSTLRKNHGKTVRISKSSCNTEAFGNIDELNSYTGVIISQLQDNPLKEKLYRLQKNLLTIGSIIAGSDLKLSFIETRKLEKEIDLMDKKLPKLTNFIYPGGNIISAKLHYLRTLARRAERSVVGLSETEKVAPLILKYLNRLSDYLFTLARNENFKLGVKEKIWRV